MDISGTITALAFGGQGILRHEGMVIFVPFTAIGDEITCTIVQRKKKFAEGKLVRLIKPGPGRTQPLCPYYGTCGGCQLQHLEYDKQIAYKQSALHDALFRIGHIKTELPLVEPAALQWTYRRHITLHLEEINGFFQAGYYATDNKSLIPVEWCPIFNEKSDPVLIQLGQILSGLQADKGNQGRATLFKQPDNRYILSLNFERMPGNCQETIKKALENSDLWQGISAQSGRRSLHTGQIRGVLSVSGMTIGFKPYSFIQNHPEQSLKIYESIKNKALDLQARSVVDLYCGIGISSLILAREGIKVLGIESNPEAIAMAKENAKQNGISAQFECADAAAHLAKKLKSNKPDLVVVNPPREGLAPEVTKALLQERAKHIIYISCMPATLARDLKSLTEGYAIQTVEGFDMFPQTGHLETVVALNKIDRMD